MDYVNVSLAFKDYFDNPFYNSTCNLIISTDIEDDYLIVEGTDTISPIERILQFKP
jgi:hypothetical protein